MKLLLIGFFALALTLGVGCKKESVNKEEQTQVLKTSVNEKGQTVYNFGLTGAQIALIAEWPYDENVYPHSTGLCYCGKSVKCHGAPPCSYPPCQNPPPY